MSSYQSILNVLNNKLAIEHLFLENESSMHNVPANSETHFKLIVVSDDFIELTKVKRHQLIYTVLAEIMNEIHALSIQTFTLQEYKASPKIHSSPDCSKKI